MSGRKRFAVLAIAFAAGATPALAQDAKSSGDVVMSASAVKWEAGPAKGTRVAKLWGDPNAGGPYGALILFDAGLMNPMHKHTQDLKIVVIRGQFVFRPEGGKETTLGRGSYLLQAGGKEHVSGCSKAGPCEFFMTSQDKFDMIPKAGTPSKEEAPKKK